MGESKVVAKIDNYGCDANGFVSALNTKYGYTGFQFRLENEEWRVECEYKHMVLPMETLSDLFIKYKEYYHE